MQRKASHLEASCSNLTEEVQRTRLDVLAERKLVFSLRSEVCMGSLSRRYYAQDKGAPMLCQTSCETPALSERAACL